MKALLLFATALCCAAPALADVTVTSPANGATVTSPFTLVATASACSSQVIGSMGYSIDSGTTTIVKSTSFSASVAAPLGTHVLHVKSWGKGGAACSTSVSLNVVSSKTTSTTTDVTVASPVSGASVLSPFTVAAGGTLCKGQPITTIGYALDGKAMIQFSAQSISDSVTAKVGSHSLHVVALGNAGATCGSWITFSVQPPPPVYSSPVIPDTAVAAKAVQALPSWATEFDVRTTGTATGAMQIVPDPSLSGTARQFNTTYTSYGGQRYHVSVPKQPDAKNFVLDTQVYLATPSSDIANVELDLNQVRLDRVTILFGFQCDGWSHTWDYTENAGTLTSPRAHWLHSNQTCDPQAWAGGWHHVQIQYSMDDSGNVTYQKVWLDGAEQDLNITVFSAFGLNWSPSLVMNLQIDGATSTSGSSTVYLDNTTIYSW